MDRRERSARWWVLGGTGVAIAVAVGVLVALASGDDSGPSGIDAPAVVSDVEVTTETIDATIVRTLVAPGAFDCVTPGSWQPFAGANIVVSVAEAKAGQVCDPGVVPLPSGWCTPSCDSVPADWTALSDPAGPALRAAIVAPDATGSARVICYRSTVAEPPRTLPLGASIDDACPTITSDTVDIPVPPAGTGDTVDIPTDPYTTDSVDIPS